MYRPNIQSQQKQYKINNQITAVTLRVIGEDGKQVGILPREEAIEYAVSSGSDLVLITEAASPPVARIIDYKKFLYQEKKKEAEAKKGQKGGGFKEVRIGSPFAGEADVQTRVRRIKKFIEDGYNVKVVVKFAGRQITHPEFGYKLFDRIKENVKDVAKVERESRLEGKNLVVTFSPIK